MVMPFLRALKVFKNYRGNDPSAYDSVFAFCVRLGAFLFASLGGALFIYSLRIGMVFWSTMAFMVQYVFIQYEKLQTETLCNSS